MYCFPCITNIFPHKPYLNILLLGGASRELYSGVTAPVLYSDFPEVRGLESSLFFFFPVTNHTGMNLFMTKMLSTYPLIISLGQNSGSGSFWVGQQLQTFSQSGCVLLCFLKTSCTWFDSEAGDNFKHEKPVFSAGMEETCVRASRDAG